MLFALFASPSAHAVNAYIPNYYDNTVSVIDTGTNHVVATINDFSSPIGAAVTPDGAHAYIVNFNDNTVSVVDTATNMITASVNVPIPPESALSGIAISPDGSTAYVLAFPAGMGQTDIAVIDTASNVVTDLFDAGAGPWLGLAVTPDGTKLYAGAIFASYITAISTDPFAVIANIYPCPSTFSPFNLAITPDGTTVYVSCWASTSIGVVSTASESLVGTISTAPYGDAVGGIVVTADGSKTYASVGYGGSAGFVLDINPLTNTVSDSIPTGTNSGGMAAAMTPDGQQLYVENEGLNSVSVIATATDTLTTAVPVGTQFRFFGQFIQPGLAPSPPTQNAEQLGQQPCCPNSVGSSSAGEPIDIASGNMAYQFTDYKTQGQNPLAFTRYYNSRGNASGIVTLAGELGVNWRSNFDRFLQINSPTQVTAERADGRQYIFTLVGSTWTPNADVDITLAKSGSTWTLTDHDDTVETYTTNGGGTAALLNTIQSRNGYTQTLHYTSGQVTSVTDSYSRALNFTYNTNGTLNTVTTPDSTTLTYGYNSVTGGNQLASVSYSTSPATEQQFSYTQSGLPFALTGITDENGNSYASWTYDPFGRGTSSQFGTGANLTNVSYVGGNTIVTNAFGVQDTYSFITAQNRPKITQISRAATSTTAHATETFGYDSNGYMNSKTDWDSNETTYVNNAHGDPTTITEAYGSPVQRTTTVVYDSTCVHLPHSVATNGVTTSYTYDSHCDSLTKTLTDTTTQSIPYSTNGQTHVWTYTWNNFLLASVETPNLKTTHYYYSGSGALTEITNPLSQSTNITSYTGGGYPETITDPNNVLTTLTWNPRQWLTKSAVTTTGGVLTTTYTLDPVGELTELTLPDNSYLSYIYDPAHRLTDVIDADNNEIEYTLDALGDKTQIDTYNSSDTLVRQHSATFDALGRMLTDVGGEGQTTSYSYDPNGNNLDITDPLLNETIRTFDALNRLSTSTDANHGVTQFTYDAHDRILTAEDPDSNTTSYVYDGFGNPIQLASPDSNTSVYYFDSDNNQTKKVDALGIVTNNTYDALDRVLTTQYPAESSLNVAYTYDQTGSGYGFGIGRLTSLTDAAGSLSRSYDERGDLLTNDRTSGSTNLNTTYTYDPASRIASVTYPSGSLVTNVYDAAGYLHQVKAKPTGTPITTTLATLTHLPFGPINSASYGNGVSESWTFDEDYRSTNITDTVSSTTLQNLTYGYDADNNVKTITDAVNAANGQTLGYDVLNRINSAVSGTGGYGSLSWTYDNNGNVKTFKVGSSTTSYTYMSGTNRLATIGGSGIPKTVSTDANGNITSIPPANSSSSATFSYGNDNRLASVTGSPVAASFVYDAFGQRFSKADSGSTPILYSYLRGKRLMEENNNGAIADYIYADGRPISVVKVTSGSMPVTSYILADRLGTPQLATSSSHSTVWSTTYQPYGTTGTITGTITQNLRLPGQNWDSETGFYYNIQRDYMPNIGRYLEADPIGIIGDLNTYAYVRGNPVKWSDTSGTCGPFTPLCIALVEFLADEAGVSIGLDTLFGNELAAGAAGATGSIAQQQVAMESQPELAVAEAEAEVAGSAPLGCFMGRRGDPLQIIPYNTGEDINGISYSGHAFDQMQGRGVTPTVVENTIATGLPSSSYGNTTLYTDPVNGIQVVTNSNTGVIVTVKTIGRY